ncbi:MAG: CPBP family intramembrane metalloprotease [Saprospiraceae bacterium]|nr:CPBP family intramembrane metalloprotease [Saprospiraceae bacterium]
MQFLRRSPSGNHSLVRYVLGILIILTCYMLGQIPLSAVLLMKGAPVSDPGFMQNFQFSDYGIDNNTGFTLLLLMFVAAMLGLWFVVRAVHQRSFKQVMTASVEIRYSRIFLAFGFWLVLNVCLELLAWLGTGGSYSIGFDSASFPLLLLISLVLLPVQTSFEELFFRGYLMHGLAIISSKKWVPVVISSLAFGLMHIANPEIQEYGWLPMLLFYISAGVFLAYLAVQDQGLELSLGVHAATNFFGAVIVNYEGSVLQTDALFLAGKADAWLMLVAFWLMSLIFVSVASKKYQWPSWQSVLIGKITD